MPDRVKATWASVSREPLVLFSGVALGLFILYAAVAPSEVEEIRVTPEWVDGIAEARAEVLGRPVTPEERDGIVRWLIDEEVLVREAMARGHHERDGKVRERLASKMLFLLEREPLEPSEADLQEYWQRNQDRYTVPASITFEHVFFDRVEPEADLLGRLRAGEDAATFGERFWLGSRLERISREELEAVLGAGFAGAVSALDNNTWEGPLGSSRGLHYVRLLERHAARPIPREYLGARLESDWSTHQRETLREARIEELRSQYRIVVEPGAGSDGR